MRGEARRGPVAAADGVLAEARAVDVSFAGRRVLESVDLVVRGGETVTLVGPNGAGKTTLLKVLLGLLPPDKGTARIAAGVRVGYMPQRLSLDPVLPLSVRRFLSLAGRAREDRLRATLRETGAERVIGSPIQEISGGELQRVLLARALLRDPDLLVLDEPVQGVDVAGQIDVYRLIDEIRERRGCGVLLVTHNLHLVMANSERVVCLNRHVCCAGHPEAISRHPEYLALFGPEAAELLAVYTHRHDHRHDAAGRVRPALREGEAAVGESSGGATREPARG